MALPAELQNKLRTELAKPEYAGLTSAQKALQLNAYPMSAATTKAVPGPPNLKELLEVANLAEQKTLIRHPSLGIFVQIYSSGDLAAAARWCDAMAGTSELSQPTVDAMKVLLLRTKDIAVPAAIAGLPKYFELARGVASAPNVVTEGDINAL